MEDATVKIENDKMENEETIAVLKERVVCFLMEENNDKNDKNDKNDNKKEEIMALLKQKAVREAVVAEMGERGLKIVLPSCTDARENIPVNPLATEYALNGIKQGTSVENNGTTIERESFYKMYSTIFFSGGFDLSMDIAKQMMEKMLKQTCIIPVQDVLEILVTYSMDDSIYQRPVKLTPFHCWFTLGMAPIRDDWSHFEVPKDMISGSRRCCVIMGVHVKGQARVAILYLGSLYMPYVNDVPYNSYTFSAVPNKEVSIQFKSTRGGSKGPLLKLKILKLN